GPGTRLPRASWPRSNGSISSARTTAPQARSRSPNCSHTSCPWSRRAGSAPASRVGTRADGLFQLLAFQQPFQGRLDAGLPPEAALQLEAQPREIAMLGHLDEADPFEEVGLERALVHRTVAEHLDDGAQLERHRPQVEQFRGGLCPAERFQ